MVVRYYAVKDLKMGFQNLQPFQNDAVASRAFLNAGKNPNSPISTNPEDFELWFVGEFDDVRCLFDTSSQSFICNGVISHE